MTVLSWIRLLSALCISSFSVWSQTHPLPRSLPYTESFGTTSFSTLPPGWAVWNGINGSTITSLSAAEASVPTGDAVLTAVSGVQTGGGAYGLSTSGNARLYIHTSSNATNGACQPALAISTLGWTSVTLQYDLEIVAANPRTVGMVAQVRVGSTGSWTSLSGSGNPFSQAGGSAGLAVTASLALPGFALNQPLVELRWAVWRGTETGSSSGIAVDNLSLTGTSVPQPSVVTGTTSAVTSTGATLWGSVDPAGDTLAVFFEVGTGTSYGAVIPSQPDTVSGSGIRSVSAVVATLTPGTLYHYRIRAVGKGLHLGVDSVFTTLPPPLAAEPTQASLLSMHGRGSTRLILHADGGNGARHLFVLRKDSAVQALPWDGTTYAASADWSTAPSLSDGSRVVGSGSDTALLVTGLEDGTRYHGAVFEYHDGGFSGAENYLTSSWGSVVDSTVPAPGLLLCEENAIASTGTALTVLGWTAHSSAGILPLQVGATGLGVPHHPGRGLGGGILLGASGEDVHRVFPSRTHGSTVLLSALVQLSSVGAAGDYFLHLGPSSIGSTFRARVFAKSDGAGGILFGVNTSGTPVTQYSVTPCALNTTHLIVLRYRMAVGGTSHRAELFVNPSMDAPLPSRPDAVVQEAANVPPDIGCVALRQGSSGSSPIGAVDAIRVGSAWGAVSGAPVFVEIGTLAEGWYESVDCHSTTASLVGPIQVRNRIQLSDASIATGSHQLSLDSTATVLGESDGHIVSGEVEITTRVGILALEPGGLGALVSAGTDDLGRMTVRRWTGPGGEVTVGSMSGIRRRWRITSEHPPTAGRVLTLRWHAGEDNGINPAMARVWHSTDLGGTWSPLGPVQNAMGRTIAVSTTSFSEFTVSDGSRPLPVELRRFSARRVRNGVLLEWETATEILCDHFRILRRDAGDVHWEEVAWVPGQGTRMTPTRYTTRDDRESPGERDREYRLEQVDRDGTRTEVGWVRLGGEGEAPLLVEAPWPQPCRGKVFLPVYLDREGSCEVVLRAAHAGASHIAFRGLLSAGWTTLPLRIPELWPDGLYLLEVQSEFGIRYARILLMR